jgi:two-component system KDP operon response regulator KdpE
LNWESGENVKKFTILLVDDEERILNFLKTKLKLLTYEVILAGNGVEALEQVRAQEPDLVVLDIMMPRMDGFQALQELRVFSSIPVIILSARGDDADRIRGLNMGADDYLPKPFNPDELVARIESIRRRLSSLDRKNIPDELSIDGLNFNFDERHLTVRGKEVNLTRMEWLLLSELVINAGHLLTYYDLLGRIWGPEYRNDIQILRTWITRLRSKIEIDPANPKIITTEAKTGYIFNKL